MIVAQVSFSIRLKYQFQLEHRYKKMSTTWIISRLIWRLREGASNSAVSLTCANIINTWAIELVILVERKQGKRLLPNSYCSLVAAEALNNKACWSTGFFVKKLKIALNTFIDEANTLIQIIRMANIKYPSPRQNFSYAFWESCK